MRVEKDEEKKDRKKRIRKEGIRCFVGVLIINGGRIGSSEKSGFNQREKAFDT